LSKFPVVNTDPGVTRQVLADHPDLMVVAFEFAKQGAEGKLHHHPHIQSTFVKSGGTLIDSFTPRRDDFL